MPSQFPSVSGSHFFWFLKTAQQTCKKYAYEPVIIDDIKRIPTCELKVFIKPTNSQTTILDDCRIHRTVREWNILFVYYVDMSSQDDNNKKMLAH